MVVLLVKIFLCFFAPSPVANTNTLYQKTIYASVEEDDKKEESKDTTLENILLGNGVGLVAVGGIGAGIIAHNNNKPKDVPYKEIESAYDENGIEKKRLKK